MDVHALHGDLNTNGKKGEGRNRRIWSASARKH